MKISKYIIISLVGMTITVSYGCKSFLEDSVLDKIPLSNYIQMNTEAVSFFYGGICSMQNVAFGQNYLSTYELPSDQTYFTNTDETRRGLSSMDYMTNSSFVENVWRYLYEAIGQMNILEDRLENGPLKTSPYTPRLLAQARFLRAYCYFDAVRLWGPVPITRAYYDTSGDIKPDRSSVEDVYKLIVDDLTYGLSENRLRDFSVNAAGAKIMPDTVIFKYPNDAATAATNYFLPISKGAAQLLLAKVYLTRNASGDYANAEKLIDEMIANSQIAGGKIYALLPNYGDLFDVEKKTVANRSREVLFEIEASSASGVINRTMREVAPNDLKGIKPAPFTNNNQVIGVYTGYGAYVPTEYFLSSFDGMKDKRYFWMYQFTGSASGTKPTWSPNYRKGYDQTSSGSQDNGYCNAVLLRYADVLLIKAELRARANDAPGMKAAIDPVLARAGLDSYNTAGKTQAQMIDDILMERAREFAHEAGNRLFDMRRTGFEAAMNKYQAWYNNYVVNANYYTHNNELKKAIIYINPKCQGNPEKIMMNDPSNPGTMIENPRQDQAVGGDRFVIPVPFLENAYSFEKKYSYKSDFHPIPNRELMQNPNLRTDMNHPDWN